MFEFLQKSGGKDFVPLLSEMNTVVGQGNIPLSGIGKADTQLLRLCLTELGKGMRVVNELLAGHPPSQGHWWRCNQ